MNGKRPFLWQCGTHACVGDIVKYPSTSITYIGHVYWCDYFGNYQVDVGTGLTLSVEIIDDFKFIRRDGAVKKEPLFLSAESTSAESEWSLSLSVQDKLMLREKADLLFFS